MKRIIVVLLLVCLLLLLLLFGGVGAAIYKGLVSKSDMQFLADLYRQKGLGAVIMVIETELGLDQSASADPSYGRVQIAGRGHAPWVLRGNLDDRPRMLKFALAPGLWAAYETERASLYQLWEGEVLFEGSVYDYRHGPQPASRGSWYLRDDVGAQWFIESGGVELPASVQYLGHEYGPDKQTARLRYALVAADHRVELTEQPEVIERDGQRIFTRRFERVDDSRQTSVGFHTGSGERFVARGTLEFPLETAKAIKFEAADRYGTPPQGDDLALGESVIANGDCLGCHAPQHRIAGPAWSEISGKFRAKSQGQVVAALSDSVRNGSVGTWGQVPMPAHPNLSREQANAAVAYILSTDEPEAPTNPPLDELGNPYAATLDYAVRPRLESLHPSFQLEDIAPEGFEPKVGGMAFRADGKLVLCSWDRDGAVFLIDPAAAPGQRVRRIAEGLHEPLGLTIVDGRLFVLQKQELTELVDRDGDEVIDQYRSFSYDWPSGANFHSFAFGLLHRDDAFYMLLSICVLPGGASCPEQLPTQGKLLRLDMNGKAEIVASGFRTPNGIAVGPQGGIYVNDNQGDWLPASKLLLYREGGFYGSRAVPDENVMALKEIPPVVWFPQDEVGNSPTAPFLLEEGPYAGQLIHGDVYNGGIKRVYTEQIKGQTQGVVFHFSAGFKGGVNRMARGPNNAIYLGEVGNPPNWGEYGKAWHGLERMTWVGNKAFEILAVKAQADGFVLEMTQPLAGDLQLSPTDLRVKQWFYHPNEQYGGPKYDETVLAPVSLELSDDRRSIRARIPGLRPGYVVYLRLDDRLRSQSGAQLWTSEAWYTLNTIPANTAGESTPKVQSEEEDWRPLFDGQTLNGWRNYGGDEKQVEKWVVEDGALTLQQQGAFPLWDMISSVVFGGGSGDLIYYREKFRDFELSLEWKIAENGNSGIFYFVEDERENTPWLTGIEMQVLDNDGHADGKIKTHRAGDLYDLIAAQPETVRPPGQWNQVLIRVKDNHIEHWLNGVQVVSVLRASDEWNALVAASKFADMPLFGKAQAGYIVLQDHGDPVWYRNIRVRTF